MTATRQHQSTDVSYCRHDPCRISLMGGFEVSSDEGPVDLPTDAQRLIAFLALQSGRVPRAYVAGTLWIDGTQDRAFGNLRSTLWRLRHHAEYLINADTRTLAITSAARVDVSAVIDTADRLCAPDADCTGIDLDPTPFTQELLPGWYDEWAIVHRERMRQRSLHALEALADRLTTRGCYALAIQAALAAIHLDPLREAPHRCLIRTHLAEGNYSEAITHYERYRTDLHTELGISPSPRLDELVSEIRR